MCQATQVIGKDATASCVAFDADSRTVVERELHRNAAPPGTAKGGVERSAISPTAMSEVTHGRGQHPSIAAFVQLVACTLEGRPREGTGGRPTTAHNTDPGGQ